MSVGALPYLAAFRPHKGLLPPRLSACRHGPTEGNCNENQDVQIAFNHELLNSDRDDQRRAWDALPRSRRGEFRPPCLSVVPPKRTPACKHAGE
jgi:hypothetical protein